VIDKTKTRLKIGAGLFAFFTVDGLLLFGYKYFEQLTHGNVVPFAEPLIEELTGSYGAAILVAVIMWGTWRFRLARHNWQSRLPVYMLGMVAYSAAHTLMNALLRHLLFPLAGLGQYYYGIMALRFRMEFFNDIASFWMWVLLLHLFYHHRESRDREVRTAQLESELTRAQLANLRAQLQPHFLCNTLNAISSHMYQDPCIADRMLAQLSDLLRAPTTSATQQKVILSEELEILKLYFDIMKGRFEDRLDVTVHVDPECERALVPSMILQPLAENSIRHGTSM
jgi:hypothetical protein